MVTNEGYKVQGRVFGKEHWNQGMGWKCEVGDEGSVDDSCESRKDKKV